MCTLVQTPRLCTGRAAYRGSRGIDLLFLDHGTRRGWGVSVTPRPLFTPGKDPVPIVQEAGWAPGPVWRGAENLAPTGSWSPYRPAHSRSLCRLRYPAQDETVAQVNFCYCNVSRNLKLKQQYCCANNSNFIKTQVDLFWIIPHWYLSRM